MRASVLGRALAAMGLAMVVGCAGPSADPLQRVRGPLPTRILQPAGLLFPAPRPQRAKPLALGAGRATVDLHHASIFERSFGPDEAVVFDGEITRLAVRFAYGIAEGIEMVLEPSVLFGSSGFLDAVVDDFHELTGFAQGGRDNAERDQYAMRIERNGVDAYSLEEDRVLFGDLGVGWLASIRDEDDNGPSVAARIMLELPTGDEGRGSGSGGIDIAAGVLMERSIGRWTWNLGLDGVRPDAPEAFVDAGIDVRTLLLASGGVEYRWSNRMSILGQAVFQSPLTRTISFEEIDREILDLGIGVAYDLGEASILTVSFHEDAVAASGPDLTLYFGLSTTW